MSEMCVIFLLGHIFFKIRWDGITWGKRQKLSETSRGDRQNLLNVGLGECSSEMMKVLWKTRTEQPRFTWNKLETPEWLDGMKSLLHFKDHWVNCNILWKRSSNCKGTWIKRKLVQKYLFFLCSSDKESSQVFLWIKKIHKSWFSFLWKCNFYWF